MDTSQTLQSATNKTYLCQCSISSFWNLPSWSNVFKQKCVTSSAALQLADESSDFQNPSLAFKRENFELSNLDSIEMSSKVACCYRRITISNARHWKTQQVFELSKYSLIRRSTKNKLQMEYSSIAVFLIISLDSHIICRLMK